MSDTETVELDPEAKRLKLQHIKTSEQKGIIEDQKAILAGLLPTSDLKPLEGKVDVGAGVGHVGKLLAYELLQDGASTIVDGIKDELIGSPNILIVEDRALVATDWTYSIIQAELQAHEEALLAAIKAFDPVPSSKGAGVSGSQAPVAGTEGAQRTQGFVGPAALVSAIPTLVGAAAGLVGMFRSNYSITGNEFTIGATPLVAAVTEKLLALDPVPDLTVDQFCLLEDQIIAKFQAALKSRLELERLTLIAKGKTVQAADRELQDLRTLLATYAKALGDSKPPADLERLQRLIDEVRAKINQAEQTSATDRARVMLAEAVSTRFDTFATEVTTAPKDGGYPPLVRAAMRERLHGDNRKHTHVLFVGVDSSGGEMITRQSYFAKSGVAVIVGGAQVSYLLLKVGSNKTVAAGSRTLLGHLKYDLKNGEAGPLDRSDLTPPSSGNGQASKPNFFKRFVKHVIPIRT
jgi:hypothetical protein